MFEFYVAYEFWVFENVSKSGKYGYRLQIWTEMGAFDLPFIWGYYNGESIDFFDDKDYIIYSLAAIKCKFLFICYSLSSFSWFG